MFKGVLHLYRELTIEETLDALKQCHVICKVEFIYY